MDGSSCRVSLHVGMEPRPLSRFRQRRELRRQFGEVRGWDPLKAEAWAGTGEGGDGRAAGEGGAVLGERDEGSSWIGGARACGAD